VAWRRLAAALVAGTGLACASATSYLDPGGPLHEFRREPDPPAPLASGPLRAVSFNIAYAVHIDRALEVLRTHAALRDPDVLALQEMDAPGTARIAKALGMNAVYFASGIHPKYGRDFGCAVLSPWPLEGGRKLVLPHAARVSGLRRSAAVATVVRGSERVQVYSVHLPSPLAISGGSRREQLRVLAQDAATSPDPVLIAGDFNSYGKLEELERGGLVWLTRDLGDTTRVKLLGIPITSLSYDHFAARGLELAPGVPGLGVVSDNHDASDHLPIWALLVPSESAEAREMRPERVER
jgi:endonuclease/exonuclease/phosphatase family metal-dependent hydrolase